MRWRHLILRLRLMISEEMERGEFILAEFQPQDKQSQKCFDTKQKTSTIKSSVKPNPKTHFTPTPTKSPTSKTPTPSSTKCPPSNFTTPVLSSTTTARCSTPPSTTETSSDSLFTTSTVCALTASKTSCVMNQDFLLFLDYSSTIIFHRMWGIPSWE